MVTAQRKPLRKGCFGFAGGVRGPAFQLQSEDNFTYGPEDVSWMERFIKNDRKSIMGLNRLPEANQKDKPSVSDYHIQLMGDKPREFEVPLLTPSKMRSMSVLNLSRDTKPRTAEVKSRQFIRPGALPQAMLPCLRVHDSIARTGTWPSRGF